MRYRLRCYAYADDGNWQAYCTDFDIAVEADSFQEAKESLEICIQMYLEEIAELPEAERRQFLGRKSPWRLRAKLAWKAWLYNIRSTPVCQQFILSHHLPSLS